MSTVVTSPGFLTKERTIAGPAFSRWLVPPAALAIHLCIGMAYGFSVFWLPLSRAIGITQPAAGDWKISTLGWMFTLFFVMLGSSAALFGAWVEREGPRKAGVVAACCWSGGGLCGGVAEFCRVRGHLLRRDDGGRVGVSPAAPGMAPRGLDPPPGQSRHRRRGLGSGGRRVEDAAVLVSLGRAVHERDRRHR